jgi:NAD(P)-dependent dehydrogenase (short-subunit alcohol dehydrogenase family)
MHEANHVSRLLLFGANGNIGRVIGKCFVQRAWKVVGTAREINQEDKECMTILFDPFKPYTFKNLNQSAPFDAVCWAQGSNCNDSIYDFDLTQHLEIYKANCVYILESLKYLLNNALIAFPARFCVISSIWQNIARQNKLSYTISKAALYGLINSLAIDLGKEGHLINAVLPGILANKMTYQNLSSEQITSAKQATFFSRLADENDVASMVYFLCSQENRSITGQNICVDLGFANARII